MVTTNELRAIPLFSELAEKELEYLAGTVADIRLASGEYVVHEGESRALFIAIEGKLEVTKIVGGIECVIGSRKPGELFGEVPIVLNTPFLASLRAVGPARVIRIEPKDYHTIAAAAPAVSATVGAAALDRIEGLQDVAQQPLAPDLLIVGPRWDTACHTLRDFLHRNRVPFDWLMPDEPAAAPLVAKYPEASRRYPIVRLQDGTMIAAPSLRDVARAVGVSIAPKYDAYDVVIVGGGPAGLAAAVYGASEGLRTVLVEREAPGGQAGTSSRIENYLGFPFGVSGDELAGRMLQQAKRLGAEIVVTRTVESIDTAARTVLLDGGEVLQARNIILALGVTWRRLALELLDSLTGRGVYYGAARSEARSTQGKDIFLIGGGNSAGQAALFFANHARSVTLVVRGDTLTKSMSHYLIEQLMTKSNVEVELRSQVVSVQGDEHLDAIEITNAATGATRRRNASALFILIGADADTSWLPAEIARDSRGYILTGVDATKTGAWTVERDPYLLETTVPGIFAIGDIRAGSVKRVTASVGEGSMAIAFVHQNSQTTSQEAVSQGTSR